MRSPPSVVDDDATDAATLAACQRRRSRRTWRISIGPCSPGLRSGRTQRSCCSDAGPPRPAGISGSSRRVRSGSASSPGSAIGRCPGPSAAPRSSPDPAFDLPRRVSLAIFSATALIALVARRRSAAWAGRLEVVALAAGAATVVFGALGWGGGPVGAAALLVQLAVLFAATGGVFAAMILGHWYLVTPRLPEAPLILLSRILLVVVALQVALFVAWVGLGAGPAAGGPFSALTGPWALFVWLRLIVGLDLPAGRVVGSRPDGSHAFDGIGDRPPVHQRRHDRGRHHPCGRAVFRRRPAGLTSENA